VDARLSDPAPQSSPRGGQADVRPDPGPKAVQSDSTKKGSAPPPDKAATQPALREGENDGAGSGVLRRPGQPDRDVPLMSIQKDEPRVQVGPVTKETGVADVLLGSLGIVAVAVIGSLILGAVLGVILVYVKHRLGWGGPDKDADEHISLMDR
jgi:hypothetical protein